MNAYREWDLGCACSWLFCLIIAASLTIIRLLRAVKRTMNCEKGQATLTTSQGANSERLGKLIKEKFGALRARRRMRALSLHCPTNWGREAEVPKWSWETWCISRNPVLIPNCALSPLLLSQNALRGCRNFVQKEDYCCC